MRIYICCVLLCIALSITPFGVCAALETEQPAESQQSESTEAKDKELTALRGSAQAFVEAFNKGDAQAVAALWSKEGEYLDGTGRSFVGREAVEKAYTEFFAENDKARIQLEINSLRLLGDEAALEDGRAVVQSAPTGAPQISDYSVVHVKVGGSWQMASVRDTLVQTSVAQQNLADLDWLVGAWLAEEHGNKSESVCRWVGNQSFVQRDFTVTRVDGTQTAGVQLIGWNPQGGYVQSWTFSPDGGHAVGTWTPTESGWSAQMQGITGDGMLTSSINSLKRLDDNAYVWQSVDRTLDGVAFADTDEVILKRLPPKQ